MSRDVFGTAGDFTTSPEISQLFGELVALWFLTQIQSTKQSHPKWEKFRLLELGPGRGTLMSDVLRTLTQYKGVAERIESVHMVEASPHLRGVQATALGSDDVVEEQDPPEGAIRVHWHEYLEDVPKGMYRVYPLSL